MAEKAQPQPQPTQATKIITLLEQQKIDQSDPNGIQHQLKTRSYTE